MLHVCARMHVGACVYVCVHVCMRHAQIAKYVLITFYSLIAFTLFTFYYQFTHTRLLFQFIHYPH